MSKSLEARRWNNLYKEGRYEDDPPVAFVKTILDDLGEEATHQTGLYVGCGNGRNYIDLYDAGLDIRGIDISNKGIEQLKEKRPDAPVWTAEFTELTQAGIWSYLVAIQVFQHGDKRTVDKFFKKATDVLLPEGKLYLRVNSTSTEIYDGHTVLEQRGKNGNKTVLYTEGGKNGMKHHFYTARELGAIASKYSFNVLLPPYEVVEQRKPPRTGTWTQWETIWQKA